MSRFERAMLGLYGGAWLALLAVAVLALWFGRGFELLLNKDGSGVWAYLALWMSMAIAIALSPSADRGWRAILVLGAFGLAAVAGVGWWRSSSLATATAVALIVIAAATLCLAPLLDARRVQRRRPQRERNKARAQPRRTHLALAWTAWTLALCTSFWLAWRGSGELTRGGGAVLLLGVFFLALPAVVLGAWRRRLAAVWLALSAALSLPLVAGAAAMSVPLLLLLAAGAFIWADARRVVHA